MHPDGTVLDDPAFPLPVWGWDVTSDGRDFLVVGGSASGLMAVRIGEDGTEIATSLLTSAIPSTYAANLIPPAKVAFGGSGYLVVWQEAEVLRYARLALDGTVLDPGGVLLDDQRVWGLANVAFDGTSYVVAWGRISSGGRVATIGLDGDVLHESALPFYPYDMDCKEGRCFAAFAGWTCPPGMPDCVPEFDGQYALRVTWMTPQGEMSDPQGTFVASPPRDEGRISVGFNNRDGVVVWSNGSVDCSQDQVRIAQVSAEGVVLQPDGVVLQNRAGDPAVAWTGQQLLVAWRDDRGDICGHDPDVYGSRITPQLEVLDAGGGALISKGFNSQFDPALTYDGQGFIVAWSDDRENARDIYMTRLDAEGAPVDPAATRISSGSGKNRLPSLSFDGTNALLAWWKCYSNSLEIDCTVAGAQAGPPGITPQVFPYHIYYGPRLAPALSSVGEQTLMCAYRDETGLALGTFGTNYSDPIGSGLDPSLAVASASDDTNHFIVWASDLGSSPLYGARVAPDGTVLDDGGFLITPPESRAFSVSVAYGAGEHLVVWRDFATSVSRILATRVSSDGTVMDSTPLVLAEHPECSSVWDVNIGRSAVTFDGQRFVVAWKACGPQGSDLFGALVSVEGQLLTRFPLTADAYPDELPALASAGDGTALVAYSSLRTGPPFFGAWRVATHHLDGTAVLAGQAP